MSDPFAAIRPYNDGEVRPTIDRLLGSKDFLNAMLRLRFGESSLVFAWFLRPLVRFYLRRQLTGISGVHDLQMFVRDYVERLIQDSTAGLSVSGLEHIDPKRAHLFISNHRDIAMDPALTNYVLHRAGYQTLRIAIGDNLLREQWVADIMRLNKSFVVKRSVAGPRELLANSKLLSQYIRSSLQDDNASIWIAQREGRAKNGRDRTEAAVIKMLSLSRDKQTESFAEHIASLR
ncbi:MAG: 1-acyl-sn-glycerol-3-phosphate acyltransferase, partial [Congregibacter sp.]|nr:1-acyl-sn-glycerol-3-phosphate acyltransferase [Congregibacter sp.]